MANLKSKARIIRMSVVLKNICFAGLVLWAVAMLASFIVLLSFVLHGRQGSRAIFQLTSALVLMLFGYFGILNLFRYFKQLQQGQFFQEQTLSYLKAIGRWCVTLSVSEAITMFLGAWIFHLKMGIPSAGGLIAGLAIIFVAWLFEGAHELQNDQDLTI